MSKSRKIENKESLLKKFKKSFSKLYKNTIGKLVNKVKPHKLSKEENTRNKITNKIINKSRNKTRNVIVINTKDMNKKNQKQKNIVTFFKIGYFVDVQPKNIKVYSMSKFEDVPNSKSQNAYFDEQVLTTTYKQVFIGEDKKYKNINTYGNSVLINVKHNEYIFINSSISVFKSIDPIVEFHGDVGNNSISYAYAIDTSGRIYLLIDSDKNKPSIPVIENHETSDPWGDYYGHTKNKIQNISFLKQVKEIHGPV